MTMCHKSELPRNQTLSYTPLLISPPSSTLKVRKKIYIYKSLREKLLTIVCW